MSIPGESSVRRRVRWSEIHLTDGARWCSVPDGPGLRRVAVSTTGREASKSKRPSRQVREGRCCCSTIQSVHSLVLMLHANVLTSVAAARGLWGAASWFTASRFTAGVLVAATGTSCSTASLSVVLLAARVARIAAARLATSGRGAATRLTSGRGAATRLTTTRLAAARLAAARLTTRITT